LFRGRIKVISTIVSHSPLNISETVRDTGLVPWFGESGGHFTNDVT